MNAPAQIEWSYIFPPMGLATVPVALSRVPAVRVRLKVHRVFFNRLSRLESVIIEFKSFVALPNSWLTLNNIQLKNRGG